MEISTRHLTWTALGTALTVLAAGAGLVDSYNGFIKRQTDQAVQHERRDAQLNARLDNLEVSVRALARRDAVDQDMINDLINSVPKAEARMRADNAMQRALDQQLESDMPSAQQVPQ